jgi:hypothetical protein
MVNFNLGSLLNRQPMPMQPQGGGGGLWGGQPPMSGPMPVNLGARVQQPGMGMPGYGANPPGRILPPQMPVQPGFGMNPPGRVVPAMAQQPQSRGPFSVGGGWLDWRHPKGAF